MGSSASKVGRAAPAAARRYPSRNRSGQAPRNLRPTDGSTRQSRGNNEMEDAAKADGNDTDFTPTDFSQRLHEMGMVQPSAPFSPLPIAQNNAADVVSDHLTMHYPPIKYNAALSVLEARRYLQQQANIDIANPGLPGRQLKRFINMRALVDTMKLRDQGISCTVIEERLCLEPGTVRKLGRHGVFSHVSKTT